MVVTRFTLHTRGGYIIADDTPRAASFRFLSLYLVGFSLKRGHKIAQAEDSQHNCTGCRPYRLKRGAGLSLGALYGYELCMHVSLYPESLVEDIGFDNFQVPVGIQPFF
jgi:hypothetical protein